MTYFLSVRRIHLLPTGGYHPITQYRNDPQFIVHVHVIMFLSSGHDGRLIGLTDSSIAHSMEPSSIILTTFPIGISSFALEERLRRQPQPLYEIQHI